MQERWVPGSTQVINGRAIKTWRVERVDPLPRRLPSWALQSAAPQPGDLGGSFGAAIPAGSPSGISANLKASGNLRDVRQDALPPEVTEFLSGAGQKVTADFIMKAYAASTDKQKQEQEKMLLGWLLRTVLHQAGDLDRAERLIDVLQREATNARKGEADALGREVDALWRESEALRTALQTEQQEAKAVWEQERAGLIAQLDAKNDKIADLRAQAKPKPE